MSRYTREGMAEAYFSNGTEWMMFEDRCCECRHFLEGDEPLPPKPTVPGNICAWAISDRIVAGMTKQEDSQYSYHPPEDIDPTTCPPTCLRFTHKDDGDGEHRDPPQPDAPGQMMLGDHVEGDAERVLELVNSDPHTERDSDE